MTDRLRNLLQQADAAANDAPLLVDLAPNIRRRVRQRRQRRALVAAVGIFSTAVLAIFILAHASRPPSRDLVNDTTIPPHPIPLQPSAAKDPYAIDPVADLRDDAACTMVVIARRRANTLGPADAAAVYRRTIELYPESHWAAIARNELAILPH